MCLACEMDALWFAEIEAAAGTACVPSALDHGASAPTPGSPERVRETPAVPASPFVCEETRSQ